MTQHEDRIAKQQNLVHRLLQRTSYDPKNQQKLADYEKAKRDLITLKYAEVK